jgi:hypothetical protein
MGLYQHKVQRKKGAVSADIIRHNAGLLLCGFRLSVL